MAEENIKVAVRVRPFNQREKDANSRLIVDMQGNQTIVTNPKNDDEKMFAFDHSYWSHDGFKVEPNGYYSPENSKYCDQKRLFDDLGSGVLKNAWDGFNASLFAYGQTGAGKSYSIIGFSENKGIVPLFCEEIFKKKSSQNSQIEVTFSMLEIYSEVVRDLLNPKSDKKNGLPVREDSKKSFFPQGLTKTLVENYTDISRLMDTGNANRTIAATSMNSRSSRAHTIVTISLVQKYKNESGKEMAKSSIINLVDLAGSERASQTGNTGEKLKESAAINLSLSTLGNVINLLAENAGGKNNKVPYRDSVLTKLLMNALGGNSKTIMIAAISPAHINYEETLSTLRYADRAKHIKCKAIVNEDPTEKLISDLRAENERLKKLLQSSSLSGSLGDSKSFSEDGISKQDDEALRKQLEENEKAMKQMQQSYEEKLSAARAKMADSDISKVFEKAKRIPHLSNVNMDPSLTGKIKLLLEGDGPKRLAPPGKGDIPLNGLGIISPHAIINCKNGKFTIESCAKSKVILNGKQISQVTELNHRDRLLFGASQYYVFIDPAKARPSDSFITFESMQDEIGQFNGMVTRTKSSLNSEQLKCQTELIDLLPSIDEANTLSIEMDKKVKFTGMILTPEARGDYSGQLKAFVVVKFLPLNIEWVWTKDKFGDRKQEMLEYYSEYNERTLDKGKFKHYDPFFEYLDTPTQMGTTSISLKPFFQMRPWRDEYKIIDLRHRNSGILDVEIVPCHSNGNPVTERDGIRVTDPKRDLLNKELHFILRIIDYKNLDPSYENFYCVFQIPGDPTIYKTATITDPRSNKFNYSQQFTMRCTTQILDFISNKALFIQVWGEHKHPTEADEKYILISTQEYFNRELELLSSSSTGKLPQNGDAEKLKLREDLEAAYKREKRNEFQLKNIGRLIEKSKSSKVVNRDALIAVLNARTDAEVDGILKKHDSMSSENTPNFHKDTKRKASAISMNQHQQQPEEQQPNEAAGNQVRNPGMVQESAACTLL